MATVWQLIADILVILSAPAGAAIVMVMVHGRQNEARQSLLDQMLSLEDFVLACDELDGDESRRT